MSLQERTRKGRSRVQSSSVPRGWTLGQCPHRPPPPTDFLRSLISMNPLNCVQRGAGGRGSPVQGQRSPHRRAAPCRREVGVASACAPGRAAGRDSEPGSRSPPQPHPPGSPRGVSLRVEALCGLRSLPVCVYSYGLGDNNSLFPTIFLGKVAGSGCLRATSNRGVTCCQARPPPEPLTRKGHLCPHSRQVTTSPS